MRATVLALAAIGAAARTVAAHGDHDHGGAPEVAADADWITRHMAEEHHMTGWDAASFFSLHDYDSDGQWTPDEILRTYGLDDASNAAVPASRRAEIAAEILALLDADGDGAVSLAEWAASPGTLPDVGAGPGHHGDDEYEYEIHHWEKYHNDDSTLDELTHPEDVAHFRKHDELEDQQARLDALEQMPIVEDNIPAKFRRAG
jgi:hypothetical protein